MSRMLILGRPIVTPITTKCGAAMRLADSVRDCVVFLGFPGQYQATGFLVGLEEENDTYRYLVTARHVATPHLDKTPFVIRANLKDGPAEDIDIDLANWTYHPDPTVDVAVIPFDIPARFESAIVRSRNFVDEATRKRIRNVGVGSLAHVIGLFRLHRGKTRNLPIVHTGHIALEASDERIPAKDRTTGKLQQVEGYLVEAHTLDGLSGSPVFVRRSREVIPGVIGGPDDVTSYWAYGAAFLLGLWLGAWDGEPGTILAEDRSFHGNVRVPVGMGIVVPADKIMETLSVPELREARRKSREESDKLDAASMDSAFPAKSKPPATDENPRHKEDFTSLVSAVARKRPRAGQTSRGASGGGSGGKKTR